MFIQIHIVNVRTKFKKRKITTFSRYRNVKYLSKKYNFEKVLDQSGHVKKRKNTFVVTVQKRIDITTQ